MTDWGALARHKQNTVAYALAGLDQEMPSDSGFGDPLAQAIAAGQVPQARLDDMVLRILTSLFEVGVFDRNDYGSLGDVVTSVEHVALARHLATQATVLLRNEGRVLPLNATALRGKRVAVIGDENTDVQSGSGHVFVSSLVTPSEAIAARLAGTGAIQVNATYHSHVCTKKVDVCEYQTPKVSQAQIDNATAAAQGASICIVSVATSSGEGYDRPSLSLGASQEALIAAVTAVCPHTIVVVRAPGAVLMPWAASAAAIVLQLLPGQEVGR